MGELIFSGSETLPAASAAEVTLVLDNEEGRISLPYREVSISRRISRAGETEYRINGSRARLADVRAVAGEIGLGRHSILRQGAVDSIVAGGAAACRLALEEAAGTRGLPEAARLGQPAAGEGRRPTGEEPPTGSGAEGQLRRIEREAEAAREYREIEARYRELSLAHLYRIATRELDGLRQKVGRSRSRSVATLAEREREMREEERTVEQPAAPARRRPRKTEFGSRHWRMAPRTCGPRPCAPTGPCLRIEAGRGREGERRLAVSRLEDELRPGVANRARPGRQVQTSSRPSVPEKREESDRIQKEVARPGRRARRPNARGRSCRGSWRACAPASPGWPTTVGRAVMSEEDLARLGA